MRTCRWLQFRIDDKTTQKTGCNTRSGSGHSSSTPSMIDPLPRLLLLPLLYLVLQWPDCGNGLQTSGSLKLGRVEQLSEFNCRERSAPRHNDGQRGHFERLYSAFFSDENVANSGDFTKSENSSLPSNSKSMSNLSRRIRSSARTTGLSLQRKAADSLWS